MIMNAKHLTLTKDQQAQVAAAQAEGKRRVVIKLTPAQQVSEEKFLAKVEAEREEILEMGRQHKAQRKERAQSLADRLRQLREQRGFSLAEVARLSGMTRQAVHRIETGENTNPKIDTIARIAQALGGRVYGSSRLRSGYL